MTDICNLNSPHFHGKRATIYKGATPFQFITWPTAAKLWSLSHTNFNELHRSTCGWGGTHNRISEIYNKPLHLSS